MIDNDNAGEKPQAKIDEHGPVSENNCDRIFSHIHFHHKKEVSEDSKEDKNRCEDKIVRSKSIYSPVSNRIQSIGYRHSR